MADEGQILMRQSRPRTLSDLRVREIVLQPSPFYNWLSLFLFLENFLYREGLPSQDVAYKHSFHEL